MPDVIQVISGRDTNTRFVSVSELVKLAIRDRKCHRQRKGPNGVGFTQGRSQDFTLGVTEAERRSRRGGIGVGEWVSPSQPTRGSLL